MKKKIEREFVKSSYAWKQIRFENKCVLSGSKKIQNASKKKIMEMRKISTLELLFESRDTDLVSFTFLCRLRDAFASRDDK